VATVARKVCDLDGREDGVQTISLSVGSGSTKELDLCERCVGSVKLTVALDKAHRPVTGKSPKRFAKTDLPPQPS
jgi:hypothetical protein